MLDLELLNDDEYILIGTKGEDFFKNPVLSEYTICKIEQGFRISYSKIGQRNQKYSGNVEVEKIVTTLNNNQRSPELINYICENSNIRAKTLEDEFDLRLNNIIYYKLLKRDEEYFDETEV